MMNFVLARRYAKHSIFKHMQPITMLHTVATKRERESQPKTIYVSKQNGFITPPSVNIYCGCDAMHSTDECYRSKDIHRKLSVIVSTASSRYLSMCIMLQWFLHVSLKQSKRKLNSLEIHPVLTAKMFTSVYLPQQMHFTKNIHGNKKRATLIVIRLALFTMRIIAIR